MKQLFAMLALGLICWATPSRADPAVLCYVWANDATPTTNPYTPPANYSYDAAGAISINHTATGTHTVTCAGVGGGSEVIISGGSGGGINEGGRLPVGAHLVFGRPGGHVQVSAYGDSNTFCHVKEWANTVDLTATVLCFGRGGGGGPALADSPFDLMYVR